VGEGASFSIPAMSIVQHVPAPVSNQTNTDVGGHLSTALSQQLFLILDGNAGLTELFLYEDFKERAPPKGDFTEGPTQGVFFTRIFLTVYCIWNASKKSQASAYRVEVGGVRWGTGNIWACKDVQRRLQGL